jgi:hypothetical protein
MRRITVIALVLAGCGGSPTGDEDAASVDAAADGRSVDGSVADAEAADAAPRTTRWTVTIVEPPRGAVVILPTGMDHMTGAIAGYVGPGAWEPQSRPVRVSVSGEVEVLEVPEANYGFAWGAGAASTVGEHAWQPHVWDEGGRTPLPVPEGFNSGSAHAVAGGVIVGSWADYDDPLPPEPVGPRPCAWIEGEVVALPTFDGETGVGAGWAVNADGVIAGSLSDQGGVRAVRWATSDAPPVAIGPFAGAYLAEARAINGAGDVAGRVSLPEENRAFFDDAGDDDPVLLPFLPGGNPYAEALDLDETGDVVGTASAGDEARAVLWRGGAILDLNDAVVELPEGVRYLSSAVGIDQDGRIAAEAVMEGGFGDSVRYLAILEPADASRSRSSPPMSAASWSSARSGSW